MFLLHVEKNKLILLNREPVTSGSVNIYDVRFEFSADWEGLDQVAVFRAGCVSREVQLGPSGACLVPWEVLRVPGYQLKVGVYGKQGEEVVLPTAWVSLGMILEGVILEDVPTGGLPPSSPGLWEQELARKGDCLSYTEEGELGLYSGDKLLSSVPVSGGGGGPGVPGPPGLQGEPGPAGEQGPKGEDGFSPIISISEISGGHQVTITDADGTHSFDVIDGKDGAGGEVYSTVETRIGTWIDGRPLYRRVLQGTTGAINEVKNLEVILNLDNLINLSGVIKTASGNFVALSFAQSNFYTTLGINLDNNMVYVLSDASNHLNSPITVTVEYTKTTD